MNPYSIKYIDAIRDALDLITSTHNNLTSKYIQGKSLDKNEMKTIIDVDSEVIRILTTVID